MARLRAALGAFQDWEHTHTIHRGSQRIKVMLVDGAAYTIYEWLNEAPADYERQDNGDWTFQGRPFTGEVIAASR